MATPSHSLTNKQNAQHSTGPRSPEGKQTSSRNALRHGLTSQTVVLPGEDAEAYAAFRATVWTDLAPVGAIELVLAQTIADTEWRLERARTLEVNLIALAHFEEIPAALAAITDPAKREAMINAHGYDKRQKTIHNLQLQEARLQRTLMKALKEIREAQASRKAAKQVLLDEAVATRILCQQEKVDYDAAEFGFDFTDEDLDREVVRRKALRH